MNQLHSAKLGGYTAQHRMIYTALAWLGIALCGSHVVANTVCNHKAGFAAACPGNAKLLSIDKAAQSAVVAAHNAVRQQWASGRGNVNATACRMATISWHSELARLAELNVKQCKMQHDNCHNTPQFKHSGQNIYWRYSHGKKAPTVQATLQKAVTYWANEGAFVTAGDLKNLIKNATRPVIGHVTLLINELNTAVGCALSSYKESDRDYMLLACNYATNNWWNSTVYRACSKAGSACHSGANAKYPALCSSEEVVNLDIKNEKKKRN